MVIELLSFDSCNFLFI